MIVFFSIHFFFRPGGSRGCVRVARCTQPARRGNHRLAVVQGQSNPNPNPNPCMGPNGLTPTAIPTPNTPRIQILLNKDFVK